MVLNSHYEYINGLVAAAKKNDGEALVELAEWYKLLIKRAIRKCIGRNPSLEKYQEDLEADMHLILKSLISEYDSEQLYFSYYLSTRLERAITTHAKKAYPTTTPGRFEIPLFSTENEETDIIDPHDSFVKITEHIVLAEALNSLNDNQRVAIELYFFQEFTQETAAKVLGITQASFSKRLQRALKSLKEFLE